MCQSLGYADHYLCAWSGTDLVGLLPLVGVNSRLFGRSLTSLPFCSYAGPIAVGENAAVVMRRLIEAAVEKGRHQGVNHVELRAVQALSVDAPRQSLYSTFRAPIPAQLE